MNGNPTNVLPWRGPTLSGGQKLAGKGIFCADKNPQELQSLGRELPERVMLERR